MSESVGEQTRAPNFEFDALRMAVNYRRALIREFSPYLRGRVLEVGAGIGQIAELLRKVSTIKELLCVEPDPSLCRTFRDVLPGQALTEGTIGSVNETQRWDAIVSINVLEHIREDERELAAYARLLVREEGHLCLFVPARQEIYAPMDKDFGHERRYSKVELNQKLERAGFEIIRLNYFNCVGYFAWWLNFCLLKKRCFNTNAVRIFDRVIFPIVNWCESRICPPPFGQSLIAVARPK